MRVLAYSAHALVAIAREGALLQGSAVSLNHRLPPPPLLLGCAMWRNRVIKISQRPPLLAVVDANGILATATHFSDDPPRGPGTREQALLRALLRRRGQPPRPCSESTKPRSVRGRQRTPRPHAGAHRVRRRGRHRRHVVRERLRLPLPQRARRSPSLCCWSRSQCG